MAMAQNLQQGQSSEWALLRRHESENEFGVQIAGGYPDQMGFIAKVLENETSTDFVDLNCACPIDLVCNRGCGSALLNKPTKMTEIVNSVAKHLSRPITIKS
jgi:tRNA-dihydrouridine synthase 3